MRRDGDDHDRDDTGSPGIGGAATCCNTPSSSTSATSGALAAVSSAPWLVARIDADQDTLWIKLEPTQVRSGLSSAEVIIRSPALDRTLATITVLLRARTRPEAPSAPHVLIIGMDGVRAGVGAGDNPQHRSARRTRHRQLLGDDAAQRGDQVGAGMALLYGR